jgi:hypothetical protein
MGWANGDCLSAFQSPYCRGEWQGSQYTFLGSGLANRSLQLIAQMSSGSKLVRKMTMQFDSWGGVIAILLIIQVATCPAQTTSDKALKGLLQEQGFTGQLTGEITFTHLGGIGCSGKHLQVYYYEWEESNPPGRAIHQSKRIIFVDKKRYLGSYIVEDRPTKIGSDSLRFDYTENLGNEFKCDRDGLPNSVLLNGEPQVFAK